MTLQLKLQDWYNASCKPCIRPIGLGGLDYATLLVTGCNIVTRNIATPGVLDLLDASLKSASNRHLSCAIQPRDLRGERIGRPQTHETPPLF